MRTLIEPGQGRQCDALQDLMGHTRRQAKGSKKIHTFRQSAERAVPQSGCHGRGVKAWPAWAPAQAAGSWQGAGQGSRGTTLRAGTWMSDPGGGGGWTLKTECWGPSRNVGVLPVWGGVARARGNRDRDLSLLCLRDSDNLRSNCSGSTPLPASFPFRQHSGLNCLFMFMP